jgi:hypothetical protein
MNTVVVRCAGCQELSRVMAEAVGLQVACPRCGVAFVAVPDASPADPPLVRPADPARVPVVRPRPKPPTPLVWEVPEPAEPEVERTPPTGGLIALSLLPFGIPLLWLLAAAVTQREVLMSFAVPVALAVGVSGLGLGTAYVTRWSVSSRAKAVIALLLVGYLAAGLLFIVKKEWLQDFRRVFNRGDLGWRNFRAEPVKEPGKELIGYRIQFPVGEPVKEVPSPFSEGTWKAYAHVDPTRPDSEVYSSAVGRIPGVKPWAANHVWFPAVGKIVRAAAPADAVAPEETPVTLHDRVKNEKFEGREFHFTRPNDVWSRVVRVYNVRGHVIYLAVEGPHLTPDAGDVSHFFESLRGPFE